MRLRTERLVLRPWTDEDLAPFAALNADPAVMRHFPNVLTRAQSDDFASRIRALFDAHGYGLFAVEVVDGSRFIGFVGLAPVGFSAHFTPAIEIGWRLASMHQGRGYATEAARACVELAFGELRLGALISMTTAGNTPSRHVMEKLGMRRDPGDDFDHPKLPEGHPMRRHVLYRLTQEDAAVRR